jgi:hypothetical protein
MPLVQSFLVPHNCILAFKCFPSNNLEVRNNHQALYSDGLQILVTYVTVMPIHLVSLEFINIFKYHCTQKLMLHQMTNTVHLYVYLLTTANILFLLEFVWKWKCKEEDHLEKNKLQLWSNQRLKKYLMG